MADAGGMAVLQRSAENRVVVKKSGELLKL